MIIYLIHFSRPYRHARHYLGSTKDLAARLAHHRAGSGARLLEVCNEHGIDWDVARTWDSERQEEYRLKAQHNAARLCPICNPSGWQHRATNPSANQ